MKNLVITLLLLVVSIGSNAQSHLSYYDRWYTGTEGTFGILGGCVGAFDDLSQVGVGAFMSYDHYYLDVMGWPRWHENSESDGQWDDRASFAIHFGYEIPLSTKFSITPVIGYAEVADGVTDGDVFNYNHNGYKQNAFYVKSRICEMDYGGVATFRIKGANIKAGLTRHTLWAGVGFFFSIY